MKKFYGKFFCVFFVAASACGPAVVGVRPSESQGMIALQSLGLNPEEVVHCQRFSCKKDGTYVSDNTIGHKKRKDCLPNLDTNGDWVDMVQQSTPAGRVDSIGQRVDSEICKQVGAANRERQTEQQ